MNTAATIIWSAAAGSMGLVVLLGAADALHSRSRASVQSLVYLTACWLFFMLLSGLAAAMLPSPGAPWLPAAQVLIGPPAGAWALAVPATGWPCARRSRATGSPAGWQPAVC